MENISLKWRDLKGKKVILHTDDEGEWHELMKFLDYSADKIEIDTEEILIPPRMGEEAVCIFYGGKYLAEYQNKGYTVIPAHLLLAANQPAPQEEKMTDEQQNNVNDIIKIGKDCREFMKSISQPPSEPSGAEEIARNTKILYKEEFVHGDFHSYPYLDEIKLASDITALVDAEKEKYAAGFAEWADKMEYVIKHPKCGNQTITFADLLHIYNTKNQ